MMRTWFTTAALTGWLLWGWGSPGPRWHQVGTFSTEQACADGLTQAAELAAEGHLALALRCYEAGIDPTRVHPFLYDRLLDHMEPAE
jgi:hypothetical protein